MDKETRMLQAALEEVKEHGRRLREKREQRLWQEVSLPCGLVEAVGGLSKQQMDRIRKKLALKGISSLSKAKLAEALVRLIPVRCRQVFSRLDREWYDLVRDIAGSKAVVVDTTAGEVEALLGYGIVFPGIWQGENVLYMPREVREIFLEMDGAELEEKVKRNSEWIRLTNGLLYYYGVMAPWVAQKKVMELTGGEIDFREYLYVIQQAEDFYGQVRLTGYGFQDDRVFDGKKIVDEQKMRTDVEYYPFTRKQLLEAGDPDFSGRSPAMEAFIRYLEGHYDLCEGERDEISRQLTNMINQGAGQVELVQYLGSWLEFPTFEFVQELTAKVVDVYNNTRQWVLKGHTPDELFQREKKFLKPLPAVPFGKVKGKVVEFKPNKVGRNEPCPCGSGKKYKRCCGN